MLACPLEVRPSNSILPALSDVFDLGDLDGDEV